MLVYGVRHGGGAAAVKPLAARRTGDGHSWKLAYRF